VTTGEHEVITIATGLDARDAIAARVPALVTVALGLAPPL
jgi:hypothetical protein